MKEYFLTNLIEFINLFVSLVITGLGIWGSFWLKKRDKKYNENLEEFKNNLMKKNRIFEDKYTKDKELIKQIYLGRNLIIELYNSYKFNPIDIYHNTEERDSPLMNTMIQVIQIVDRIEIDRNFYEQTLYDLAIIILKEYKNVIEKLIQAQGYPNMIYDKVEINTLQDLIILFDSEFKKHYSYNNQ